MATTLSQTATFNGSFEFLNKLFADPAKVQAGLATREALSVALNEFEGTVILVSHDRALLRAVCDEFWLVTRGGVLPFGGHKGYGLSFAIQALGLLAGAARTRGAVQDFAFLFWVINPEIMLPGVDFAQQMSELVSKIKNATRRAVSSQRRAGVVEGGHCRYVHTPRPASRSPSRPRGRRSSAAPSSTSPSRVSGMASPMPSMGVPTERRTTC